MYVRISAGRAIAAVEAFRVVERVGRSRLSRASISDTRGPRRRRVCIGRFAGSVPISPSRLSVGRRKPPALITPRITSATNPWTISLPDGNPPRKSPIVPWGSAARVGRAPDLASCTSDPGRIGSVRGRQKARPANMLRRRADCLGDDHRASRASRSPVGKPIGGRLSGLYGGVPAKVDIRTKATHGHTEMTAEVERQYLLTATWPTVAPRTPKRRMKCVARPHLFSPTGMHSMRSRTRRLGSLRARRREG